LQEIADNPEFFVGDATRFDVQQGELGEYEYMCIPTGMSNIKKSMSMLKVGCVNKFNYVEVISEFCGEKKEKQLKQAVMKAKQALQVITMYVKQNVSILML
jgi:hypothetical protein